MIDLFGEISAACKLEIPAHHHRKIGIIGAGGIVEAAHLPAYKKAGLPIFAITDINISRAEALATKFAIPKVFQTAEELLADDSIEVVDIAVPASEQPALLMAALEAGKHVLAQNHLLRALKPRSLWEILPQKLVSK